MIVLLKAAGAFPVTSGNSSDGSGSNSSDCLDNHINHIFYAEQHTNKHSLAHTIMTVTELLRNDDNMKTFYRYHRPFKQLIVQLYKKYGAKSQFIRIDPGISYALNHLMRVLYIKSAAQTTTMPAVPMTNTFEQEVKSELAEGVTRVCSNPDCSNEETKYKPFKACSRCSGQAAYCSSKCKQVHIGFHRQHECTGKNRGSKSAQKRASGNIYENVASVQQLQRQSKVYENLKEPLAGGANNFQRNSTANSAIRRPSEGLPQKNGMQAFASKQQGMHFPDIYLYYVHFESRINY